MNQSQETVKQGNRGIEKAGWATIIVSLVIVAAAFVLAIGDALPILEDAGRQWSPLLFAIVGVLLYIMSSARTRRERFDLSYLPDYCFRGAQAVVYLYIIMAIIAQTNGGTDQYSFESWPPNLIGLFVGMFILHVEKAMEGLGQRFEELLAALLPRALTARTSREKQLDRLRASLKFDEVRAQSEALASQIADPAMSAALRRRLADVTRVIRDGDLDGMQDEVSQLSWEFEELKRALREEGLTVEEILAAGSEEGA